MNAIRVKNLHKVYPNGKEAVKNISFEIKAGEVYGFLGPNGAGKTTVVKILTGILSQSGGSCDVLSMDPSSKAAAIHQIAGVVTEHSQMYDQMSGLQNLLFYGQLFGIDENKCTVRAIELLKQLELIDAKDEKLQTYSTGMRQRLSLARALMHKPKVLFLDEPTSGLDPESVAKVNTLIQKLAQKDGTTIFLCTHQLRYAQEICTSYGLISNGELLATGTLASLRSNLNRGYTLRIKADCIPSKVKCKQVNKMEYDITIDTEEEIPTIIKQIVSEGGKIYSVQTRQPSLEEIYFALFDKQQEGNMTYENSSTSINQERS